jgi:regulator of extracellular matrix RemA (YlzA/DUF370 family)
MKPTQWFWMSVEKKEGLVFDYTYGRKIASVIYLKNGELVLTALSIDTLRQRMEG